MKTNTFFTLFLILYLFNSCTNQDAKIKSNSIDSTHKVSHVLADSIKKTNKIIDIYDTITDETLKNKHIGFYEIIGGWLKTSISQQVVLDSLGEPDEKSSIKYDPSRENYNNIWIYKSKGIELIMCSKKKYGIKKVDEINIKSNCKLKTSRGIGIGSSLNLIKEKYNIWRYKSLSDDENILIGFIGAGTFFHLKNGHIFEFEIGDHGE